MQGKESDIFLFNGKINAMKIKLNMWTKNVKQGNFFKFTFLEKILKSFNWEDENAELDMIRQMVGYQLELLSQNFSLYFPQNLQMLVTNRTGLLIHLSCNMFTIQILMEKTKILC